MLTQTSNGTTDFVLQLIPIQDGDDRYAIALHDAISKAHVRNGFSKRQFTKDKILDAINEKVGAIFCDAKRVYIEQSYDETVWKDMVSRYYVHLYPNTSNKVIRVHLFDSDISEIRINTKDGSIDEEIRKCYLGYFNIRPVNNLSTLVSYVMPNYINIKIRNGGLPAKNLVYHRDVHMSGATLGIDTFPFFFRDEITTVCAHADILMIARYLYRKFHFSKLTYRDIVDDTSIDKLSIFPTRGISERQILNIFLGNKIIVREYDGSICNDAHKLDLEEIGEFVFSQIDSNVPVLLLVREHVVLIVGATRFDYCRLRNGAERQLVVYDDSSDLLNNIYNTPSLNMPKKMKYIGLMKWSEIVYTTCEKFGGELSVIVPLLPWVNTDFFALMTLITKGELFNRDARFDFRRVFTMEVYEVKDAILKYFDVCDYKTDEIGVDGNPNPNTLDQFLAEKIANSFLRNDSSRYFWCLEIPRPRKPRSIETISFDYYFFDTNSDAKNIIDICVNYVDENSPFIKEALLVYGGNEVTRRIRDKPIIIPFTSLQQIN